MGNSPSLETATVSYVSNYLERAMYLVRLGAAQQHTDSVLVYETKSTSKKEDTAWQLLDWTIIGYFTVPSTSVTAEAITNALFFDVRSGYPYVKLQGRATTEAFATSNATSDAMSDLNNIARTEAIIDMIGQIEPALQKLEPETADKKH